MKRRAVLAGVPAALLFGGCTDLLSEDEVTFEADQATVSDDAQSETGYDEKRVEEQVIEREYEQVDRTVVVVNQVAEYARSVDLGPIGGELSRFTVLSSPAVEVGPIGPLNPIDEMDNDELAEMMQDEYDQVDDIEKVDERDVTLLGDSETVTKFSAEAQTQGGESVPVFLHLAQTDSGDDFVVTVGVHPQDVDEQGKIDTLISGVEHPVGGGGNESNDGE
jgi:hypothetical protein